MDYKKSLNLPKTEFPMKANLSKREPEQLKNWEDTRLHDRVRSSSKGREKFILHDGPPYARMTSYNVCYTRLLRIFAIRHHTVQISVPACSRGSKSCQSPRYRR